MRVRDWIIRNIREYDNSLIPTEDIKEYGVEKMQKAIEEILEEPIEIRKSVVSKYDNSNTVDLRMNKEKEALYIAQRK